jgi:hypothetical protein
MKLVVATLSLLVLLALSGSILSLVDRRSGFLAKDFSARGFSAKMRLMPEGWVKALRCWTEIEAPADCLQW